MEARTIITKEVIQKLEEAYMLGCTDVEAALYAGIDRTTIYKYAKRKPLWAERRLLLKAKPLLKARATVVGALHDPKYATWYLERKRKDEFSQRIESGPVDAADMAPKENLSDEVVAEVEARLKEKKLNG